MIYTIGRVTSYERALDEHKDVKKSGKSDDYEGGWVWKTYEEALTEAKKHDIAGVSQYKVYGVKANWDTDTEHHGNNHYNNLLVDSIIVRVDNKGNKIPNTNSK